MARALPGLAVVHRSDALSDTPSAAITTIVFNQASGCRASGCLSVKAIKARKLRIALAVGPIALAGGPARAQEYGQTQDLGPQPWMAGMPVQCMGIPTVVTPLPDIATARPGAILLNPQFFNLPAQLQLFIYAHECAHHIVGANESASDCWAAQTGRQQGWFRREDLVHIRQMFGGSPGDWTHAPGPQRVAQIVNCYDNA